MDDNTDYKETDGGNSSYVCFIYNVRHISKIKKQGSIKCGTCRNCNNNRHNEKISVKTIEKGRG